MNKPIEKQVDAFARVVKQIGIWPEIIREKDDGTIECSWDGFRDRSIFADFTPSGLVEWECIVGESTEICGVGELLTPNAVAFVQDMFGGRPN